MKPLRVALAGCGAVGSAFLHIVHERNREARHRPIEVVRVLVRDVARDRGVPFACERFTADLDTFLDTPADAVVEAVGGIEPMLTVARRTLEEGRDWVTANKALVAEHGAELAERARYTGAGFGTEAAVAAGVPVVAALRHSLAHCGVRSLRGILNGTTNYMLSALEEGVQWDAALDDARARGFAEADPGRDLEGLDAEDKIRVLAWFTFGIDPAELRVDRLPVPAAPHTLLADARRWGCVLRQVAEVRRVEGQLQAVVAPTFATDGSALQGTRFERNLVEIDTRDAGGLRLSGPGAGGRATASALLADLLRRHPAPSGGPLRGIAPCEGAWRWALGFDGGRAEVEQLEREAEARGVPLGRITRDGGRVRAEVEPSVLRTVRQLAQAVAGGDAALTIARRGEGCVLPSTTSRRQSAVSPFTPSETFP